MNLRMSTSSMFRQSVASMLNGETRLAHLQQQLSTGQRLVTAKDDPAAAGQSVALQRTLAALDQYGKNATHIESRLGIQENTLQQAKELMARAKDLTIAANDGIVSLQDRRVIAQELGNIRDSLLGLANTTDGNGHYVFAGAGDDCSPFAKAGGQVTYRGDSVQRRVEIAPETFVEEALCGCDVFMRIRCGDGSVDACAGVENTGTGLLLECGRNGGSGEFTGMNCRVQFDSETGYRVLDDGGHVIAEGVYASGDVISFSGMRLRIEGQPAAGDSFNIGPAAVQDVFATLDGLINALELPADNAVDAARLNNALNAGLRNVDQVVEHFINARTTCGIQLAAIGTAKDAREANQLTLKTDLSQIQDLDYIATISQHELERIALQAAQGVFLKMQGMSLFERMG